jgi:hypothetical protein
MQQSVTNISYNSHQQYEIVFQEKNSKPSNNSSFKIQQSNQHSENWIEEDKTMQDCEQLGSPNQSIL